MLNDKDTLEIYKYARQSGFQAAWMMFGVCVMFLLIIVGLIGAHLYYVKKTYETPPANIITATQENETGDNSIKQGVD